MIPETALPMVRRSRLHPIALLFARPGLSLILVLIAVSAFFLMVPGLDLLVSGSFFRAGSGFALADDPALQMVRQIASVTTALIVVAAAVGLLLPLISGRLLPGIRPRDGFFVLAVYALGPGLVVNSILKQFFGRARPRDILQFGGDEAFSNVWHIAGGCVSNCSFTSGEASSAAAMMSILFLFPRSERLMVGLWIMVVAVIFSINRIAFGGHFLSDTLLSWIIVLLIMVALRPFFSGARGEKVDAFVLSVGQSLPWRGKGGVAGTVLAKENAMSASQPASVEHPMPGQANPSGPGASISEPSAPTRVLRRTPFDLVSVVIPARNEAENLLILVAEITDAMRGRAHEILVVDDGSGDTTDEALIRLRGAGHAVRHIRHDRSAGQSRAVRSGVLSAKGDVVVTIDGDGQNDPAFIPRLVEALEHAGEGVGLCAGQRVGRTDTKMKQLSSRFANNLRTAILKDATRDTGCGLKAMPSELFRRLPFFDGWHRYLPALVLREGFGVVHIDVVDRNRRFGQSNYGIFDRGLRGALDLFGVWWLLRRVKAVPVISELGNEEERT